MSNRRPTSWLHCLFAAMFLATAALAQPALPPDVPGGKDHPLVGRYEGSRLTAYDQQEFAGKALLSSTLSRAANYKLAPSNTTTREGRYTHLAYQAPFGRSSLEVFRNQVARLTSQGFRTVFTCEEAACVDDAKQARYMSLSWSDAGEHKIGADRKIRYALLERDQAGAVTTVAIRTAEHGAPNVGPRSVISVVEAKPMQTGKIVFVDASAMQSSIASSGKVALYGILFDTDKADIKPESKATLQEIAKFLRANPSLDLVVAGHTDSQGAFDYNVGLSGRRAAAVVAALVQQHGIPAKRLTPFGAGMAAPVASNDDEAGRSKNRRVELVKR
jgi:outer membrane protein OmpA-like peptidoglycan-associated protein